MDFGIFNLMQQRGANVTSADLVNDAIRHTRIAESLGFGRAWFAEHHKSNHGRDIRHLAVSLSIVFRYCS